jgi:plastocyanin
VITRSYFALPALVCAGALVLAACSSDDDDSAADAATTTTAARPDEDCEPVGADLEASATETVDITVKEYSFTPDQITVPAGPVTFAVTNEGSVRHELAVLPGGGDVPTTPQGAPDEEALEAAGAFELEAFSPGQTCNATWELEPGTYTIFCIVELQDGMDQHPPHRGHAGHADGHVSA